MIGNGNYERLFGLIGFPLGHSFSQNFFNQKFESEKINARYVNFEIKTIDRVPEMLAAHQNLAGFNVTIPYKEQIFKYLDAIDPEAKATPSGGFLLIILFQHANLIIIPQ